ncbi:hypothetical protein [Lysinibacillus fusiformis]|uniref:hypothetical protein n=1 Tax=Lysinibacillus fusiformis TaxID=28031 RepID=UPI003CFDDE76
MTAVALPFRNRPIGDDGMGPQGPPPHPNPTPTKTLRIGHAPRLPRRERVGRLLNRLGVYFLAWAAVGVGAFWLALGDGPAGFGFIGLAALSMLLLPTPVRRVRRPVTALPAPTHAHQNAGSSARGSVALLGRLGRRMTRTG